MKKFKSFIYPLVLIVIAAVLVGAIAFSKHKHPKSKEKFDKQNGYNVDDYITLGEYKGLEATQEKVYISDDDVDSEITDELTEEVELKEALKEGDFANVTISVKVDGVEVPDLGEEEYDFSVGEEDYCKEFDESLKGKKAGDTYTVKIANQQSKIINQ